MTRLAVVAWNCYAGNKDDNVLAALSTWGFRRDPDVFALTEAMTHGVTLREWADRHGYTLIQETPNPRRKSRGPVDDTGDCALLLAPHVTVVRDWVSVMDRLWMALRYRRWHQPHRYQVAQVKVRGQRWRIRVSHWPTHGFDGPNKAAVHESAQASKRWLLRGRLPSIDVGDFNERATVLADWFGPRFAVFGKGIDVAVTRDVEGCEVTELGKGGGDHHGRFYRFTA